MRFASRRPGRLRAALAVALLLLAGAVGVAGAHATLVLGTFRTLPDPPAAGAPVELSLRLEDPTLTPVEDALVFVDLTPADGGPTLRLQLEEAAEPAGTYRADWNAAADGAYDVTVVDRTFRQEEARADLGIRVGAGVEANGEVAFVLPPTATGPRSMTTWLAWLIGLPVLVGVVVTVLVLRAGPKERDTPPAP